ncbi:MAG: helix-turn-helix transcriptional regulator [bacterium]|nr:helix-turn-helix transcriptional regulator [bacterium]
MASKVKKNHHPKSNLQVSEKLFTQGRLQCRATTGSRDLPERAAAFILGRNTQELTELTVTSLADILDVSRTALNEKFKEAMGIPPGQFIRREKLTRSADMIVHNVKLTVKALSKLMGFCSCDYFIRVFSEYYGLTPGRYRAFRSRENASGGTAAGPKGGVYPTLVARPL